MLQTFYYDPFRSLAPVSRFRRAKSHQAVWQPAVDIIESEQQYQLYVDLPGIDPQSINVTEEEKVLTIRAEKNAREVVDGESVTRSERKTGVYKRQFTLPDDVDSESISARSENGVLILTLGRKQPEQTLRKIEIN